MVLQTAAACSSIRAIRDPRKPRNRSTVKEVGSGVHSCRHSDDKKAGSRHCRFRLKCKLSSGPAGHLSLCFFYSSFLSLRSIPSVSRDGQDGGRLILQSDLPRPCSCPTAVARRARCACATTARLSIAFYTIRMQSTAIRQAGKNISLCVPGAALIR